jgi:hypothetical protein
MISHLSLSLPSSLFFLSFPIEMLCEFIFIQVSPVCSANLMLLDLIIDDL